MRSSELCLFEVHKQTQFTEFFENSCVFFLHLKRTLKFIVSLFCFAWLSFCEFFGLLRIQAGSWLFHGFADVHRVSPTLNLCTQFQVGNQVILMTEVCQALH